MEGFNPYSVIVGASPWFLATFVLLALLRGDLIPRRTFDATIANRDETIVAISTERDYYRNMSLGLLGITETVADRATAALLLRARKTNSGQDTP